MSQKRVEIKQNTKKPLVGFFPAFFSIGETIPSVKIAKAYIDHGGKAIFFGHSGKFDYLAKDIGCKIVKLQRFSEIIKEKNLYEESNKKNFNENLMLKIYSEDVISDFVEEEIKAFRKTGIEAIVSSFNLTSSISARVLNKPHIVLISGTSTPQYFKSGFVTFPENYENFFTTLLPSSVKNRIARWYLLNNKMLVVNFNKVAKKYNVKSFRCLNDILLGDHTFVCDDTCFLGLKPTKELPLENYVGPIIGGDFSKKGKKEIDVDVQHFLKKPGRTILFTLGSSHFWAELFLRILKTLNQTDYNVIAITTYTKISSESRLLKFNDNILLKKFIKNVPQINKMVDLSIISGGRGTVYTAAFSGKPVIGIPLHTEQQYYLDNMVRHGMGIRLSKKYFTEKKLLSTIHKIFDNYDKYLKNAQLLKRKLSELKGEEKAVKRIFEIVNS
jgi:UDP:flavonoid glycosyltransferase YjiC (YdhE family)